VAEPMLICGMKYTILNNKIEVSLQKHIDSINTFRPHLKHTIDQSLKHCGGRGWFYHDFNNSWSLLCALFTRPSSQAGGGIALGFDHLHCYLWDPHSTLFLYSFRNMADYKDQLEVSVIC